jgi:uncharacterized OsmC-like protein
MMKQSIIQNLYVVLILLFATLASGCLPAAGPASEGTQAAPEAPQLATARVSAQLSGPGQATVTGHNDLQYVVHAPLSSRGIHEIDTLLAAQSTCAVFVAEKAAQELDVSLTGVTATSAFDEDQQQVHVYLDLPGVNDDRVLELANNIRQRCPVYTTLAAAQSVEFQPGEQFKKASDDTAIVTATLSEFGRADVNARGHTFVMDSVPPLDGPNVELNPLDLMLGGLAACGSFVYERYNPLADPTVVVEADFDPSGVRDLEGENPRMQNIRIVMQLGEDDEIQAEEVIEQIKEQCHLYEMLEGTANIEIATELSSP